MGTHNPASGLGARTGFGGGGGGGSGLKVLEVSTKVLLYVCPSIDQLPSKHLLRHLVVIVVLEWKRESKLYLTRALATASANTCPTGATIAGRLI